MVKIAAPRAFRHTLIGVVNPLAVLGFRLLGLWEEVAAEYTGLGDDVVEEGMRV